MKNEVFGRILIQYDSLSLYNGEIWTQSYVHLEGRQCEDTLREDSQGGEA